VLLILILLIALYCWKNRKILQGEVKQRGTAQQPEACTIPVSTDHPLPPHEAITVSSERCGDSPVCSTRHYPASADEFTAECSELTSSPPPPYDEVVNVTAV